MLIAESPPDPGSGTRRFFYAPELAAPGDNLYRAVAEAIYGRQAVSDKPNTLERLKQDGFWLIDVTDTPVNRLSSAEKEKVLQKSLPSLIEKCVRLAPTCGVVFCKKNIYRLAAAKLRQKGICVLHDEPLPFPLGNWKAAFISGLRKALK